MARKPRIDYAGARHHVMNRSRAGALMFPDDQACADFLDLVADLPDRFRVRVHGYALMPNHFHLLLESIRPELSRVMQHLQSQFTRRSNHRFGRDGSIFRGRFHNRVVQDEPYWMHLLAYLHLNPVRANLVLKVENAVWTSHDAYVGATPRPDWLTTDELLSCFGDAAEYQRYVHQVRIGRELGPKEFDPDDLWDAKTTDEVPKTEPPPEPVDPEEALDRVASVTGVSREDLARGKRGRSDNSARWVAMWWLLRVTDLTRADAARLLNTAPAALTRALKRLADRRENDSRVDAWMSELG